MNDEPADQWIDVAASDAIKPGERRVVHLEGVGVVIVNVDGRLYAIEDRCTHDDSPLADGEVDGDTIVCPYHGACFSLINGEVLAPPAYEAATVFPLRIHQGRIQLHDDSAL